MSYSNTFIRVAADCPVETGTVPVTAKLQPPAHIIQYELLMDNPYRFTHEELLYEVHVRHKQIPEEERSARKAEIWDGLFSKNHPCLRASMLPKRYGWGVHFDADGEIAIYGKESPEYDRFTSGADSGLTLLNAMRSKRS
ncbi:hypothetical protein R70723_11245 [Paenibacillus sp. FSL R7-0273]|uniref:DUF6157 family protein n=1 Tax=Paenibacillus sp. FSL R7-0273 TaxID=1536772 RepID=UPI0004F76DF4|nr:DUF6157 family protein [Paenibacillus sp. FSL R7-0273]AIQ46386.1 hypothetical protein R70723_11245 [Paenibacillus sp. FSL R7-0273]OMF85720.1 hypothetical protein BK144_27565 [Paenibacillus sp. FSL R7-0273]